MYTCIFQQHLPICVRLSNAPAAFLCTRESFTCDNFNNGFMAPLLTISFLLLSVVANVVIQPHALHWTSGSSLVRRSIRGGRAPAFTIVDLFSAERDRDRKTRIQKERDRYKERDREWQRQ